MSYASRQFAKSWINHYSRKDTNHHIKGSDSAANRRTLVVVPLSVVIDDRLGDGRLDTFTTTVDIEMDLNTAANWDTVTSTDYTVATERAGKDFYIYACIQVGNVPKILFSDAATYPNGYTANNSRKIGGFHCLPGDCINLPVGHPYKDFESGAILFNSIWDLLDRPKCSPEGMAKLSLTPSAGLPALWVDIYLANGIGTSCSSVFGATIQKTYWGLYNDYASLLGKRLLFDHEFSDAATGSNEATNVAGSANITTVTFPVDTAGRSMISRYGIIGMCGLAWQLLQDSVYKDDPDGTLSDSAKYITAYHATSPVGNPIYVKYMEDGTLYLCCDMATDAVDKWLTFSTDFKVLIKHDANAAVGSVQLYLDEDYAYPSRRLYATLPGGKDANVNTNVPDFVLPIVYHTSPSSVGVAISFNDGTDERLEFISPTTANANIYLATTSPAMSYYSWAGSRGSAYWRGYGGTGHSAEVKMAAGGAYSAGAAAGSWARAFDFSRFHTIVYIASRYCSE